MGLYDILSDNSKYIDSVVTLINGDEQKRIVKVILEHEDHLSDGYYHYCSDITKRFDEISRDTADVMQIIADKIVAGEKSEELRNPVDDK